MTLAKHLTPYFYLQTTQEVFIAALRSHTGNGKGSLCQVTSNPMLFLKEEQKKCLYFTLRKTWLVKICEKKMFKG